MEKLSDEKMLQIRTAIQKAELDEFCASLKRQGDKLNIDVKSKTLEQDLIDQIETGQRLQWADLQWVVYAFAANLISENVIKCLLDHGDDGYWWPKNSLIFAIDAGLMSLDTLKCILESRNFWFSDTFFISLLQRMIDHKLPENFIRFLLKHPRQLDAESTWQNMIVDAVVAKKIRPYYLLRLVKGHYKFGDALDNKIIRCTINGDLHPVFLKLLIKKHYDFSSFNEELILTSGIDFMVKNYLAIYYPELFDMV